MKKVLAILLLCIMICPINQVNATGNIGRDVHFTRTDRNVDQILSVLCIDVDSQGNLGIGFFHNMICIYDKEGNYQYTYEFDTGGSYGFYFDEADLIHFFDVRSSTEYVLDSTAEIIRKDEVEDVSYIYINDIERKK